MKTIKVIYKKGFNFFAELLNNDKSLIQHKATKYNAFDLFLKIPQITKVDILEILEYFLIHNITRSSKWVESDEIFDFPLGKFSNAFDYKTLEYKFNKPMPSFESEYINILGELFLAGYVDFVVVENIKEKEYKEVYLSKYKADKYQSWIYFRNNFIYTGFFNRSPEDEIYIYNGKEYNEANCPTCIKDGVTTLCGYNAMYGSTSWDTPRYWSQYNVLLVRTQKAIDCMDILDGKIYHKYKDLEVEIDDKGNIIRWIGKINRQQD